uniref:MPN domain-containing protein n=1 Tax=Aegilops tauschii subsp. strangulata TaxID=200361 RepID=A0A452XF49_AEGTS
MGVECRYELAQAAYVKLALHALKHPAAAVNGLLVGRLADPAASPAVVSVADAVPLSHQPHHLPLLPTLELALTLVEDHFQAQGLAVVGYYHANARRDDADLPAVAKRVGDHIFRYFPRAAVLLVAGQREARGGGEGEQSRCRCSAIHQGFIKKLASGWIRWK